MRIGYLVNTYPRVSHSFIRREIRGLESLGIAVSRFSVRGNDMALTDQADRVEATRTQVLLHAGAVAFVLAVLALALARPVALLRGARLAVRLGRRSEGKCLRHLVYLAEACLLLRLLRRDGVTHLHAHFGTNSTTVALLCRRMGGPPYSFTVHGPEEFDHPTTLALDEKIAGAAFVAAISDFGRSQLCRWVDPACWHKLHVVRCGVDEQFLLAAPPPPLAQAMPRLVCVGRLCEQKGQFTLLLAAHELRRTGTDFELVLAGDGPLRMQLEHYIGDLGLHDCVRITGWISGDQVKEELLGCRAMVLPSFAEGLPVVIMEALALHRPVISTYVAGIPELVTPGRSGWLVPAGSVEALAAVMREALQAPVEQMAAMGQAGAAAVALRHDIRIIAAELAQLFCQYQAGAQQATTPTAAAPLALAEVGAAS
ncbi:MAG: glycosyltransferase [Phycisphaeraceae bacterium]